MKYLSAIKKMAQILPRLDDDIYFTGEYETIIFTIHLLFDRSVTETQHDLEVFSRIYRDQEKESE